MKHAGVIAAVCAGLAWGAAALARAEPAPPTPYEAARAEFEATREALERLDPEQQFEISAAQCRENFEARERNATRIWCALASRRAVSRIDAGRAPGPGLERETVERALWLSAFDGLIFQNDPWWGSPRSETISIGDNMRRSSFVILADINRANLDLLDFNAENLARGLGVDRHKLASRGQMRREAFAKLDALAAAPEGARPALTDIKWAIAALSATIILADRHDDAVAEASYVAERLAGMAAEAEPLEGLDAALAPSLYFDEGLAHYLHGDFAAAAAAWSRGAEICQPRIWPGAGLCLRLTQDVELAQRLIDQPAPDAGDASGDTAPP